MEQLSINCDAYKRGQRARLLLALQQGTTTSLGGNGMGVGRDAGAWCIDLAYFLKLFALCKPGG